MKLGVGGQGSGIGRCFLSHPGPRPLAPDPWCSMSTFIIRPKDFEPSSVKLDRMKLTIGRSSRNDICISDPFASRLHAELRREGDHVLLVDNGSANGTFLNGQRVSGTVRLEPGDLIRIGETEIEFKSEEQDMMSGATVFLSGPVGALPADTITSPIASRSTSDSALIDQVGADCRRHSPARQYAHATDA
jgi:predicted component of type VI protein secretion system